MYLKIYHLQHPESVLKQASKIHQYPQVYTAIRQQIIQIGWLNKLADSQFQLLSLNTPLVTQSCTK